MRTFWLAILLFAAGVALPGAEAPSDAKARKIFLEAKAKAEAGDAVAQSILGDCYYFGEGVREDEAEAAKWYRKAADQGDVRAQFSLGVMYAKGRGVPKDEAEAMKWYRQAADQGYAQAQVNLGQMYANGEGVPKDEGEALKWNRKAADQGGSSLLSVAG